MEPKDINCPMRGQIKSYCSCPKTDCENHGLCCTCIINHKNKADAPVEKRFPHCLRDLVKEAVGR
ncbi:MAG: hypothetical protein K9K82_09445 [Desulfobacteraceae bacterium]|nr:hypothetical protein [Desulfobacteraceae bacterium]